MSTPKPATKGQHRKVLTPAHRKAKERFNHTGQSIAGWARDHGFPVSLVHEILNGRNPRRGVSHQIAVLLGIKQGEIVKGGQS
jgi:gp16 family phage-associated protein